MPDVSARKTIIVINRMWASMQTVTIESDVGLPRAQGVTPADAGELSRHWLLCNDFVLCGLCGEFDSVVGNPPYVLRQEPALRGFKTAQHTMATDQIRQSKCRVRRGRTTRRESDRQHWCERPI